MFLITVSTLDLLVFYSGSGVKETYLISTQNLFYQPSLGGHAFSLP